MAQLPEVGAYAVLRGTQQFIADAFRVERALGGMNAATSALGSASLREFNRAGNAAQAFGTALQFGIGIGSVALAGAGVAAKNVAADFEESMSFIEVITQSSAESVRALSKDVDNLSGTGTFGLRKLSSAAEELARGGLSLQDLSRGAIEAAQNFAIASRGELDIAEAAETVAIGIQTFNLQAQEASRITDSITGVAQRSSATFKDLGVSFRYAAPGAVGLNISVEDLSATLGVLADSGIRGSRAGTALRQVFTTLIDPPKRARDVLDDYRLSIFDAEGSVRPLRDVLIDFERVLGKSAVTAGKITEAQRQNALATIFTQNAYSAMNAILNRGIQEYDDMQQAIREVSAAEVAARLLETTNARTKIFQAEVERASNAIGTLLIPQFNDLLTVGTNVAQNFRVIGLALQALSGMSATPLFEEFEKTGFGDAILPIINGFATLGGIIDAQVIPPVQRLISAFNFTEQVDSVGMLIGAFQTFVGIFGLFAQGFETVISGLAAFIEVANQSGEVTRGIEVILIGVNRSLQIFATLSAASFAAFVAAIVAPIALVGTLAVGIAGLVGRIQNFADESLPAFVNFADNVSSISQSAVASVGENFRQLGLDVLTFIGDLRSGTEDAFGRLVDNVGTTFGGLFDSIGTVANGSLDLIIQLFDDLGLSIRPIVLQVGEGFSQIGTAVRAAFDFIGTAVRNGLSSLGDFAKSVGDLAGSVGSFLAPAFEVALGAMKPFIFVFAVGVVAIAGIIKAVNSLVESLFRFSDSADEAGSKVDNVFSDLGKLFDDVFTRINTSMEESLKNMVFLGEAFGQSFSAAGEVISSLWVELWNNITRILSEVGPAIISGFEQIWTISLQLLGKFIEQSTVGYRFFLVSLGNSFSSAGTSLNNIWLRAWNGMISILRNAINAMAGMVNAFFSALAASPVGEFVGGLASGFAQVPSAVGGALSAAGTAVDRFGNTVNSTVGNIGVELNSIASGIGTTFDSISRATGTFNFEFPQIGEGFRRAGRSAEDFEASTVGIPQALGDGKKGVGGAAKGAAKDIVDLAEAFDIAANKLRQRTEFIAAFGEIGAKAAAALSDAILLRTPQNADKAVDSLFEIIDAMREAGLPDFLELGDELIAAFREAIVDGTPGAVSAALELLQQLATEIGIAGKLTVETFTDSFNRATLGAAIGKEGDAIMRALNKAFIEGSKKNRDDLAQAAISYLESLRKNFSPAQAAAYGESIMDAINTSIETGSGEFLFSVLQSISSDLEEQGRFTARSFINAFTESAVQSAHGSGSKLVDALGASIIEGGVKNTQSAAEAAFNIVEQFSRNLSPENARNLTGRFMEQLSATIQDGSTEALSRFSQFVTDLNSEARELRVAEQISEQFQKADEAIAEILSDSAAQRHIENLRDALRVEQDILQDIFQTRQEAEGINRRRDQEDEDITRGRQRRLEDVEREHRQRLTEIRNSRGKTGKQIDDEIATENARHRVRLQNIVREVAQEDADRTRRRDREDADREFQKVQETKAREFREEQARVIDKFNSNLETNRLQERIDNIIKERDRRIGEIKVENEKIKELFGTRFKDIEEVFVDPLTDDLDHMFDGALVAVEEFKGRLKGLELIVTITKPKPNSDEVSEPDDSLNKNKIESFQHGGIVRGFGRKLIWAHGGETVLPTRIPLSSAHPVAPSINNSSNTVNNNLTVNANYAQTQSPVQVRHDMQALIMLAGGR